MKKLLKFSKVNDLRDTWLVDNNEGDWLGTIMKSNIFKKRLVLKEVEYSAELTPECLKQIVNFIDSIENRSLKNTKQLSKR